MEKKFVRCKKCNALIGEESEEALILKTVYVESNFSFSCVECHTKNDWKAENQILREELSKMSKDYLAVQKEYTDYKLAADKASAAAAVELASTKLALADCLKKVKK